MIRAFSEADLPAVAALFMRVFPEHGWSSAAECTGYFREIFFDNPWQESSATPSWVAEAEGWVVGFAGTVGRPMLFRGAPIRVAVGCCFIVDPELQRSFVAVQLAKAMISGPHDLFLTDGATEKARLMWQAIGAKAPLAANLHWLRLLRPARFVLARAIERSRMARPFAVAAWPAAAFTDAVSASLPRNRFLKSRPQCTETAVDVASLAADLAQVLTDKALRPLYDEDSLAWLLKQTQVRRGYGVLRAHRVLDSGRALGWYIYYLKRGGVCEVVQLAARNGTYEKVLQHLLMDAWREGAAAVRGRVDPGYAQALSQQRCWLRWEGPATLVHSNNADITAAILHGDAFLSRLDGEWWMRFVSG